MEQVLRGMYDKVGHLQVFDSMKTFAACSEYIIAGLANNYIGAVPMQNSDFSQQTSWYLCNRDHIRFTMRMIPALNTRLHLK